MSGHRSRIWHSRIWWHVACLACARRAAFPKYDQARTWAERHNDEPSR